MNDKPNTTVVESTPTWASPFLPAVERALEMIKLRGASSAQAVADELSVSRPGAWKALEELVKEGVLEQADSANSRERLYRVKGGDR